MRKIIPLMIVPFLTSCTGTPKTIYDHTNKFFASETITSSKIYLKCKSCNGDIAYRLDVTNEEEPKITADITINSGSLGFKVMDNDDVELYAVLHEESANLEIPLQQPGQYKVILDHQSFNGSYTIKWSKK